MKKRLIALLALILSAALLLCSCFEGIPFLEDLFGEIIGGNEKSYLLSEVPEFDGKNPYVIINENVPFFEDSEITAESFEEYRALDSLGRCTVAIASVGKDLMPDEDRGSISSVKPSGWQSIEYDGDWLYNRCHLIAFQLTGENATKENLITGTRYLNIEGMLPFEDMVADYVKETGNHVMYRVTPIYDGDSLVASGVLMEGLSVEDGGAGITFCIYAYNVQPGITINYKTGESAKTGDPLPDSSEDEVGDSDIGAEVGKQTYVINKSSGKFHKESCSGAKDIKEENRETVESTRDELIDEGYSPCGTCKP